jgi:dTDP-4-amino-4,6-dideoxygalactose transaminase
MLGYYSERFGYRPEDFPGARDCERNTMAIPLHNKMTESDYTYVVDTIRSIAQRA